MKLKTCKWIEDDDERWDTECNYRFYYATPGTPSANHYKFCIYCGRRIWEFPYSNLEVA